MNGHRFAIAPDLCVYHRPDASKWKLALSVYLGMVLPVTGLMILGAAVGSSNNPAWTQGRNSGQLYGLMAAIMEPYGAGGKFLNFLFSMSMIGNLCMRSVLLLGKQHAVGTKRYV